MRIFRCVSYEPCVLFCCCSRTNLGYNSTNDFMIAMFMIFLLIQLGRTKVFLRAGQIGILDSRRSEVLDNAAKFIQRRLRTFIAHRDFISIRAAAVSLQACCRGQCCWCLVKWLSLSSPFNSLSLSLSLSLSTLLFKTRCQ